MDDKTNCVQPKLDTRDKVILGLMITIPPIIGTGMFVLADPYTLTGYMIGLILAFTLTLGLYLLEFHLLFLIFEKTN